MRFEDYKPTYKKIREATLGFLVDGQRVLLAEKKVRFGKGKITGIGGKVQKNEILEDSLRREFFEEINVKPLKIEKAAVLNFLFPYKDEFVEKESGLKYSWDHMVHAYLIFEWEGTPQESEEVKPVWFNTKDIPWERMWADAFYWTPLVLNGEKVKADFIFSSDFQIEDFRIQKLN